jgi:hypothetical protein
MITRMLRGLIVLWPSFLGACLIELLVFAWINPTEVHIRGVEAGLSAGVIYTLAFFVFWTGCLIASLMSWILAGREDTALHPQ